MGTAPPAARVFDPKGIENETRICVHYLWSGMTILNLLFPISPFFFFLFDSLLALPLNKGFFSFPTRALADGVVHLCLESPPYR